MTTQTKKIPSTSDPLRKQREYCEICALALTFLNLNSFSTLNDFL